MVSVKVIQCATESGMILAFGIGIKKSKCDYWMLQKFKHGTMPLSNKYIDSTAVWYSVYSAVENALMTNVAEKAKNKIMCANCNFDGNEFIISLCSGANNATSARKVIKKVFKALAPAKLYATYSGIVRAAGIAPDRDAFDLAANNIASDINSSLTISIAGKVKFTEEDLDMKKCKEALKPEPTKSSGAAREVTVEKAIMNPDHIELTASAPSMYLGLVQIYAAYVLRISQIHVVDGKMLIPLTKSQGKRMMSEGVIAPFIKKIDNLKKSSTSVAYQLLSVGYTGPATVNREVGAFNMSLARKVLDSLLKKLN
jgi:hypothetical protein